MSPSGKHPATGKPNCRYMTVTFELNEDVELVPDGEAAAWRDVLDTLRIYQSPSFAPDCQVVAMGAGDAMSELEAIEEASYAD